MLKHIVMWQFKDSALGNSSVENALKAKNMIENLNGEIADIVELELGIGKDVCSSSYDLVLYSVFKDVAGLESYQKHPKHLDVVDFMKEVVQNRASVDYEI